MRLHVLVALGLVVSCGARPSPGEPVTSARVAGREPKLEVTEAEGLPAERVQAIFASAAERVHRCAPGRGGKIVVRVASTKGAPLRLVMEPDPSLDPRERQCVLDALKTIYDEETAATVGGPNVQPSGFTSILTVSW